MAAPKAAVNIAMHQSTEMVACGLERASAGAAGPRPASEEGKPELTIAPWSKTMATRIPEGFHFGAPCSPIALREQRVPGAARGAEATDRMPPVTPIR